jgi:peptidoglycan/xylan/chitin deacetylase (PgdA/CDA1 family)
LKKAAAHQRLVLNIHGIGPKPSHVQPDEAHYWCEDLRVFDRILDMIPDVSARFGTPIEITFDDGNVSDFTFALPALTRRGMVASFFVCAGRIGHASYLDKKAMTEMVAAGMLIGSHGWNHIDWRNADRQTLTRETEDAKRTIEDTIGKQVDSVAIPFGSYDRRVINSLKIFPVVYTSDGGMAPSRSRFVPRVSYNKDWNDTKLSELASQRERLFATFKRSVASTIKRMR